MRTIDSSNLTSFFTHPGWMTEQLMAMGELTVDVRKEDDVYQVNGKEAELLSVEKDSLARLRCIYLNVEEPLIYAQVVIPHVTLEAIPELKSLNNQPLGKLLKAKKAIRGELFFAKCDHEDIIFQAAISGLEKKPSSYELLLRYSVFVFPNDKKLMVYEVFLSAMG